MERGTGLRQLGIAAETLFADKAIHYVLRRLVYVSEEPLAVLEGDVPVVAPDDEYSEVGVVWAPPAEVEAAARELEIELPANWLLPESREGIVEDPEREEWRQYADTGAHEDGGADVPHGSLADALRRLMPEDQQ